MRTNTKRWTIACLATLILGLFAAAAVAHPRSSSYWTARKANTAIVSSAWGKTKKAESASCEGRGGHVHARTGTPSFRHFLCFVSLRAEPSKPGKPRDFGPRPPMFWLHAGSRTSISSTQPPDLARNPLAPPPPPGWHRRYLHPDEAYARLLASSWAKGKVLLDRHYFLSGCVGQGQHVHMPEGTFFRHFHCTVAVKPRKPPPANRGEPPIFDPLPDTKSVWIHVLRDGSIRLTRTRPTDLWP